MTKTIAIFTILLGMLPVMVPAQQEDSVSDKAVQEQIDELKGASEGMNETLLEMKSTLDALKKIKLSGYIQSQYQIADLNGTTSVAGGNFAANSKSRFLVRRGRLKVAYDNTLTNYVLQIDVTQGGVGIKDAYVSVKEPWLKSFSLTGGVFDRPFGYEISYSSSSRENPERSRLFQTLFPGERELGAKIEFAPEEGPLSILNLKAGLFNGTGPTATENDNYKDFIGRAGFQLSFENMGLAIDGGASAYLGNVRSNSKYYYSFNSRDNSMGVDSSASNLGKGIERKYYGADLQIYYDLPVLGGMALRGEYITGKQPSVSGSSSFYNSTDAKVGLYHRNVYGYYITYIQNIGLSNQFVFRFDVFDPNTDVNGSDFLEKKSNLTPSDLKYSTIGLGWIYHWDSNVKFTFYYDIVQNEKVNTSSTEKTFLSYKEDIKDNVFTFRMQYKF